MSSRKLIPVYRYENEHGYGPYVSSSSVDLMFALAPHYSSALHPSPQQDGIDISKIPWDWRCGFLYMADLQRWFDGIHDKLADDGFTIKTYMVPEDDIWLGSRQVVFVRP